MLNKLCLILIRLYQLFIAPRLGSGKCKYYPTCSQYAIDCFKKYNFLKALRKACWRILRCNPFSKGGFDPVPPKKEKNKRRK